ncbi:hypothetical protein [Levilactobacillus fuyuanensis]|uniref:Uncharacterized protein n=1 Tax=Levilactobacillus fuyuanensis TaxID=2486022 RepID=A0ABW4H4E9_9LACO|nr:hypothetical protein [Levilactobacillus fuyuanensis]
MQHKYWRMLAVIFYLIVLLLVVFHQDMLAMYGMAVGMLLEAIMALLSKA